jgi:hypothetical protein
MSGVHCTALSPCHLFVLGNQLTPENSSLGGVGAVIETKAAQSAPGPNDREWTAYSDSMYLTQDQDRLQ